MPYPVRGARPTLGLHDEDEGCLFVFSIQQMAREVRMGRLLRTCNAKGHIDEGEDGNFGLGLLNRNSERQMLVFCDPFFRRYGLPSGDVSMNANPGRHGGICSYIHMARKARYKMPSKRQDTRATWYFCLFVLRAFPTTAFRQGILLRHPGWIGCEPTSDLRIRYERGQMAC